MPCQKVNSMTIAILLSRVSSTATNSSNMKTGLTRKMSHMKNENSFVSKRKNLFWRLLDHGLKHKILTYINIRTTYWNNTPLQNGRMTSLKNLLHGAAKYRHFAIITRVNSRILANYLANARITI